MMTVTGAARIFGPLVPDAQAASVALASGVVHQTSRAGSWLAEVGAIFIRSQIAWRSAGATGSSV